MVYVHTFPTLIYFLPKSTARSEREIKFRRLPFLKKSEIWHAAAGSRAKTARPPPPGSVMHVQSSYFAY